MGIVDEQVTFLNLFIILYFSLAMFISFGV